jgi:3-deoxy-D-manno-oct-2-ulosonic acid (Kdo) hydroxylase
MEAGIPDAKITSISPIAARSLEERLEQGEVHVLGFPLPFALPSPDDQTFLREQELDRGKEIVFDSNSNRIAGCRHHSPAQDQRLLRIFGDSHRQAILWLNQALPRYALSARLVRTCFHVAEEATRRLRVTARNDLLHIDALHHSGRQRIMRLFVNLNPADPRIWASSETFAKILPSHGRMLAVGQPLPVRWTNRLGKEMLRIFRGEGDSIDPYNKFMLAFTRHLKHSDEFQEKSPRRIWRFAPGQAWAAFTDSLVHADLRGRWVLDHLFLIPPEHCVRPDLSPTSLVQGPRTSRTADAA